MTEKRPVLEVITIDVRKLAFDSRIPQDLERIIAQLDPRDQLSWPAK